MRRQSNNGLSLTGGAQSHAQKQMPVKASTEHPELETAGFLAAIVQSSNDAIMSKDLTGVITSWNQGAEYIFQYKSSEIVGRPIAVLLPPEHISEEAYILERICRGEHVEHFETVRRRKDGSHVHVSLTVSPIRDPAGRIIGASKIARDITQRKLLEAKLTQAHAELEDYARNLEALVGERTAKLQQTVADLEAFSSTVSHDLRSPLRAMQGFADAVLTEYGAKLDSTGRDYLERIKNSAVRLDKLILEVLTYSRIGQAQVAISPVSLDKLLDDVLHTYPEVQPNSADIVVERPLHSVLASYAPLVQCVSNLLANAVKFVRPGERAKVRVWSESSDAKVRLLIRDTGIGIPAKLQERIFEPFQRAHPHAGYEGTGMGLAIVHKAMQRMNGKVGVESREGQGSTFWLELPAAGNDSR